MRKKVFAALLAVCMAVSMLPMAAFAAEEAPAAAPVVVYYGYFEDAKREGTPLEGNFKVGRSDWQGQTMHLIFKEKVAEGQNLWFQVKTLAPDTGAKEMVWGCNAAGNGEKSQYAFSFLNMGKQWEQNPVAVEDRESWEGLSKGTTATLTVYTTKAICNSAEDFAKEEEAGTAREVGSFDYGELADVEVLTDDYKIEITDVFFVEDKAGWDALIEDLSEESANFIKGDGFAEGADGTYAEFPWIVIRYNRQLGGAPVHITVQPGAGIGVYNAYTVESTFGGHGDSEDAVAAFALGTSVQDDELGIAPEHQAREYTVTFSTKTMGKGIVLATDSATFALPTYLPKIEAIDDQVTSDPLVFSEPDKDGKITVTGSIKYVLGANNHPVTLKITDPKTGKKIQMVNEEALVNGTVTLDPIFFDEAEIKNPVALEVKAGEEIVPGTYQYNATYILDFSGVTLAEPSDVKVPAEVKVDPAEVDVNGIAGTTVTSNAVEDAIKVAEANAISGSNVAGVEVTLTNVTIDAKLDADEEKNVSGSQLVLENAGVAKLLAKDAQTLTVKAPVSQSEKVTVALPQEVLTQAGEEDLTVKVTKTAGKDLTEVGTGNKKSKVLAEYDVEVVGQKVENLDESIVLTFKAPANAAAVAYVKADGTLEIVDSVIDNGSAIVTVDHLTKFVFLNAEQAADETIVPIRYTITVGDAEENVAGGYSREITVNGKAGEKVTLISYVNSGDATAVVIDQITLDGGEGTATVSYGELNDSIDLQVTNGKKMTEDDFKSLATEMGIPVK